MNFSDWIRYDRIFKQVPHKGGESEMNHMQTFKNPQALSVSVGNSYTEYHLMYIFLDNFHQDGKYTVQIVIHQAEWIREGKFTNQKYLSVSYLHTEYLNLEISSGSGRNNGRKPYSSKMHFFWRFSPNIY